MSQHKQSNSNALSAIIRKIILEELGKTKGMSAKGWGSAQGYTIGSDRPMLGRVEAEDEGDIPDLQPVKISRAFINYMPIDSPELS